MCCVVPILSRRSFLENRMFPFTLAVFYLGLCIHTIERALLSSALTNKSFLLLSLSFIWGCASIQLREHSCRPH